MKRLGVIGCGKWGWNYLKRIYAMGEEILIGCADINHTQLAKVQKEFPLKYITDDYRQLLKNKEVDGIIAAAPPLINSQIAWDCLSYGKDLLIEKPFVLNYKEGKELVQFAAERGLILFPAHIMLFHPAIHQVKSIIKQGKAGLIREIKCCRTHQSFLREDISIAWDLAIHDIAILHWILNRKPSMVQCTGTRENITKPISTAFIQLTFPDYLYANIEVSWNSLVKIRSLELIGQQGKIFFDEITHPERISIMDSSGINQWVPIINNGEDSLTRMCQYFIQCIEKREDPKSYIETGLEVILTLEAISESLKQGKPIPVTFPTNQES